MENERILILKMLEEGKITAEQATKLLATAPEPTQETQATNGPNTTARPKEPSDTKANLDSIASDIKRSFTTIAKEYQPKMEKFAKDMEPKFQKFTQTVAKQTVVFADKLSQTIENAREDTLDRAKKHDAPKTTVSSGKQQYFETLILQGNNELQLNAKNGFVTVKGYNGNKISLTATTETNFDGHINLIQMGNKIMLEYDENDFSSVSIDALVPSSLFSKVAIFAENKGVNVSDLNCDEAKIEGFNGAISLLNSDIKRLTINGENGEIVINSPLFNLQNEYSWKLETNNAQIGLNLPTNPNCGYNIAASSPLGNVKLGLPSLNFSLSEQSSCEAKTQGFDVLTTKVSISLTTSNAPIIVN